MFVCQLSDKGCADDHSWKEGSCSMSRGHLSTLCKIATLDAWIGITRLGVRVRAVGYREQGGRKRWRRGRLARIGGERTVMLVQRDRASTRPAARGHRARF